MKYNELKTMLDVFVEQTRNIFSDINIRHSEKPFEFNKEASNEKIRFGGAKGVYIIALPDDDVILVGKSKTTIGESVRERQEEIKSEAVKHNTFGDFKVHTIRVMPAIYKSLIEVFCLTAAFAQDGKLPVLNDKIA
ncbi:MAG: hypothetical protein GF315_12820 [candidate division Zixibacteria bacterium]|nr:hypothetical protein [candidate division Zixibacteria bacterium]